MTTWVTPVRQQYTDDCWAASLSALFGFYGHQIDQNAIIAEFYPVHQTAPPLVLNRALNHSYTDSNNTQFTSSALITDRYTNTIHKISNTDVLNAIASNNPVFYGDWDHAMLLVAASYTSVYNSYGQFLGCNLVSGTAVDPAIGAPRLVLGREIVGTYAAVATVMP